MRRPLLAGNWKMYKTVPEGVALAQEIRAGLALPLKDRDVLVAPPFTALAAVGEALRGSDVFLGGQNMHWEREGAFTGEISPPMLKQVGCSHVILGHSERRHIFGESDDMVARKTRAAVDNGLTPILCVGETLPERESSLTLEVVERQLERALRALTPDEASRAVVAYEPVWAIGTGRTATPAQAQEVHAFIRTRLSATHGEPAAAAVRILYGGSVKPDNAATLFAQPDIDGGLIGGASLDPKDFAAIVQTAARMVATA
jgi:triosephosphate isomerase (TIM)